MNQSHIIDLNGVFLGVALRVEGGFRFVAVDPGVSDNHGRMTATLHEARRAAIMAYHRPPSVRPAGNEAARPRR